MVHSEIASGPVWVSRNTSIGRAVDLRLHLSTTGMPDNMFSRGLNKRMTQIITRMSSSQWSYFQSSYVVTMNVNQVPLKPRVSWVEHPDLHRILSESRDGLTNFFPLKIEKHNIGSNRGLLTILKDLSIERKASLQAGDTDNIRVVCVDCNIFMRVLKVRINVTGIVPIVIYFSVFLQFLYDPSGVGSDMRSWMVLTLGTWHPYKQANKLIWLHWDKRIFAPLFHDLIPQSNFFQGARLVTQATYLTYVRLAYPSFKNELKEAIASCEEGGVRRVELSHLKDLQRLCEFFIPVVSDFI